MNDSDVIHQLEAVFLPLLANAKRQLECEYPQLRFKTWSSSIGCKTSYQGHNLGIECIFPDAKPDEADCVAADIGVWHISTEPAFNSFGVDWCSGAHPNNCAVLLPTPVRFSSETLHELVLAFPSLIEKFTQAVSSWSARSRDA